MGLKYKHFTREDRMLLQYLLDRQTSKKQIAKLMGFSLSSIYREIKRNRTKISIPPDNWYWCYRYDSFFADDKAKARKYVRPKKLDSHPELKNYVLDKLKQGWSPKQIEGRLRFENNLSGESVSHETIYRYIYGDFYLKHGYYKYFRRKHYSRIKKHARRKRFIPESILIRNRPSYINDRSEFGHWECDLMIFNKKVSCNLITLRERQSRYCIAIKNINKKSNETAVNIIKKLNSISKCVKSITFDQGSEFFKYDWISKSIEAKMYFCDPSSPHQKGSIENVNGVIRTKLPRSLDIGKISQSKIDNLINEINNRPMKCHGYLTPSEVFKDSLSMMM